MILPRRVYARVHQLSCCGSCHSAHKQPLRWHQLHPSPFELYGGAVLPFLRAPYKIRNQSIRLEQASCDFKRSTRSFKRVEALKDQRKVLMSFQCPVNGLPGPSLGSRTLNIPDHEPYKPVLQNVNPTTF